MVSLSFLCRNREEIEAEIAYNKMRLKSLVLPGSNLKQ